jgi:hypothetical protein
MITVASNAGAAEQAVAASQNYQANTVPNPQAAEATNKRHVLLILTPFNQRAGQEGNERMANRRRPKFMIAAMTGRCRPVGAVDGWAKRP